MAWQKIASDTQSCLKQKIHLQAPPVDLSSLIPGDAKITRKDILHEITSSGILSARELEITRIEDATVLLDKLHSGDNPWSAEEVTRAFCKRATVAHHLVNCLMDVDFSGAIERARELDGLFKRTKNLAGPLHGLPVSIKDLTAVKGLHYSMGYVSWADKIAAEDAVTVDTLRRAGAIIYAKTTMPQSGMALECVSNLYGRTLNPFNTSLTPGGSSGGEGALIACRGSILGMGTDSGGSIRAPAAFNGLYGLKGTSSRISYKGNMNNSSGMGSASSIGPMAFSIRDLKLVTKVLVNDQQWLKDASVVAKPWNDILEKKKRLSIGLIEWDGSVMPHPPIRRALEMTKNRLLEAGHEVIPLSPFKIKYAAELGSRLFYQLGTHFIRYELNKTGEPPIEAVKTKISATEQPLTEIVAVRRDWKEFKDEYLSYWADTANLTSTQRPIDALLLPAGGSTSFPHDFIQPWGYLAIYNLLDYPAVTIPVTNVDKSIDYADVGYKPISDADQKNHDLYDPDLFDGMPVAVQLVGLPLMEEELLDVASVVDSVVHGRALQGFI